MGDQLAGDWSIVKGKQVSPKGEHRKIVDRVLE